MFGADLLRRHIGHRSYRVSRAGQRILDGGGFTSGAGRTRFELRQAEVENLGIPAPGDEEIGGLDVPVDDPLCVSGFQGIGNLNGEMQ
jgi:hypothetical protein